MFKNMTMEHIHALMIKLYSNFYRLIWFNRNTVFPSPYIFGWLFSVSGEYIELGSVNMEWVNHYALVDRVIVTFPYFSDPLLLCEINSFRIKFLSIYRNLIHHSKQFHLLCDW